MGLLCLLVWTAEEASEVAEIGNEQKELQGDTQTPRFRDSWPGNFSRDTPSQCQHWHPLTTGFPLPQLSQNFKEWNPSQSGLNLTSSITTQKAHRTFFLHG